MPLKVCSSCILTYIEYILFTAFFIDSYMNFLNGTLIRDLFVTADQTIPWVGAGIGIIIGVSIVIADCLLTYKPTVSYLKNTFENFK